MPVLYLCRRGAVYQDRLVLMLFLPPGSLGKSDDLTSSFAYQHQQPAGHLKSVQDINTTEGVTYELQFSVIVFAPVWQSLAPFASCETTSDCWRTRFWTGNPTKLAWCMSRLRAEGKHLYECLCDWSTQVQSPPGTTVLDVPRQHWPIPV